MGTGNLPPFEDREAYEGFFPSLFQTWVGACFRPVDFFQSVGNSRDLSTALLFGVLVGWISAALASFTIAIQAVFIPLMGPRGAEAITAAGAYVVGMLLFGWLLALLSIIIGGLIVHFFLLIFGGANQGLTMTLRVMSYAVAPQIFAVVPFAGGCIAAIWALVLEIIGLAGAHRTDTWRAALAVITPIVICCIVLYISIGAVMLGLLGAMQARPVP